MTTSQFFVYKRPVAWTLLVATLVWGYFAYRAMPQRHDPIIPIRIATVVTIYPGADAEKVEREVTRKVERQVALCESVEKVRSLSRQNLSVVFIDLFDRVKNPEQVWQDLQGRLESMTDLPAVAGQPIRPQLNKDFGETAALMLTISSPKVSDFEIQQRAESIRRVVAEFRRGRPERYRRDRLTAVLVYPNTVGRSYVVWLGNSLLQRLTERSLIEDGWVVEAPSTGCLDFQLVAGKSDEELIREAQRWERDIVGTGVSHPDMWRGTIVRDLGTLEAKLALNHHDLLGRPDRYSYRELRRFADAIRDRLKQYPTIGKIDEVGTQDETIYLYYSSRRFSGLDLSPQTVAARLQRRNINLPGGRLETPEQTLILQPSGEFKSEQELGEVVIDAQGGHPTCLRDLFDVVRGYEDPPGVMNYRSVKIDGDHPPERKLPGESAFGLLGDGDQERALPKNAKLQTTRAVTLSVRQVKGTQIETFARDVQAALDALKDLLPSDLQIERIHNEPKEVEEKIRQFDQNLTEAIVIVVLVAMVFMEWRCALLVATSIPLTVAMTLGICQLLGIDLQQVSIAAMIIALGLLVDDPVVAGDAINRELAHGASRDVAAWLGPQKLARAILYATVTNCVAFLPLLLVRGKTGDFIYSLPVVVTASLVSSRIVSMTFTPLLGYYILRGQKGLEADAGGGSWSAGLARVYRGFSAWCMGHKAITLSVCGLALCGGTASLPLLGTAFFPKDLHGVFSVNIFLAEGSPIRQTREETLKVIREIEALEGDQIRAYTTFVGQGGPRFWLSIVPEQRADNYAQILVHTLHPRQTSALVARLKRHLPPRVAAARVTIEQLETGPPVGVPVQIRLFGDDVETLRRMAAETKRALCEIPGTDNIHDDWDSEIFQIPVTVKTEKANMAGITNEDVAMLLQTALSGISPTALREQDHLIPITARLRSDERARIEEINELDVVSSVTNLRVPISQIVELSMRLVSPKIWRRDHQRCITVKCDTASGVLASDVVGRIQPQLLRIARRWPPGCRFQFGGEYEEQTKGFDSVALALLASLAAIYLALVLQFNSVTKPLVVFAGVPFGMVGGMMGLFPFGTPFGFMAFLGVASLAGVIVSHVIVLFDYIEEARQHGEPLRQAVIDSGLVRLRPVLVTVLATVGGLIPLAIEGGPLWEPMCYVQIAGLLLATLVTLGIVPVVYVLCVENLKIIRWESEPHAEFVGEVESNAGA
jgi:multidrug efflux pump subunit AcrB